MSGMLEIWIFGELSFVFHARVPKWHRHVRRMAMFAGYPYSLIHARDLEEK